MKNEYIALFSSQWVWFAFEWGRLFFCLFRLGKRENLEFEINAIVE